MHGVDCTIVSDIVTKDEKKHLYAFITISLFLLNERIIIIVSILDNTPL